MPFHSPDAIAAAARHATVWEDELTPGERELLARLIEQTVG